MKTPISPISVFVVSILLLPASILYARGPHFTGSIIQLGELYGSDGQSYDDFGRAAIDQNTIVVGAPQDLGPNGKPGKAYVFTKHASGWRNLSQTAELTASDPDPYSGFAGRVAISGDTIVIGALGATVGSSQQGAAYVFVKPQSGWANMTETAKLTASDGMLGDYFGQSVSISGDTIVVGAYAATIGGNQGQGAEYVFVKPTSGWTSMTETAKLTASDGAAGDLLGYSSSISGNTVLATAEHATANGQSSAGVAYVFVEPANGWANMTQTAKLTASDVASFDQFGQSGSISGNTIVVGSSSATVGGVARAGAAYVYVEPSSGWSDAMETAKLTASDGVMNAYLGDSVAIDGNAVVAGAIGATATLGSGAAYVFIKPSSGWKTTSAFNAKVSPSSAKGTIGQFGYSLSVSGKTIVAGAGANIGKHISQGAAFVFGP